MVTKKTVICSWLETSNSRFMGFVLLNQNLFLGKYNRFTEDTGETGLKIDLNANFRSRKEVLDSTNFIFSQVMGARVGDIDYDDAAALKVRRTIS